MEINKQAEIKVINMAHRGYGIGRLANGKKVFVPYTLPDETVLVKLIEDNKKYCIAKIEEIITPSNKRITPRCMHFGECGGCHYQHILYEEQIKIKQKLLLEVINRIARYDDVCIDEMVASIPSWNYRNYIQFHLSNKGKLCFIKNEIWNKNKLLEINDKLIEIHECYLPVEPITKVWKSIDLSKVMGSKRIGFRLENNRNVNLALDLNQQKIQYLNVKFPFIERLNINNENYNLTRKNYINKNINNKNFRVSSGSFFQVNEYIAEKIINWIKENIKINKRDIVLELYSGVGLFTAFFAPFAAKYICIESSKTAGLDFEHNLENYENVIFYLGKVENVLPKLRFKPTIVIVDPTRKGLDSKVIQILKKLQPQRILYISCDPASLARDLSNFLNDDYLLSKIVPFDMFPQTFHIESVSVLLRKRKD